MDIEHIAQQARKASIDLAAMSAERKNAALEAIRAALLANKDKIAAANAADVANAKENSLAAPLLKRLKFDAGKIDEVCNGLKSLIQLDDPTGKTLSATELDSGLELYKISCPIGVIGVIFESRPDALVQISSLCLKSGNAVLLKGGSEAIHTNKTLAEIIHKASVESGVPAGWLGLLETRSDVAGMLEMDEHIDLIIPRGSNEFVRHIMDNTRIPVMGHADGICHVYIDKAADLEMAVKVALDSKCQYVAVCNAAETLLVHQDIAAVFLPKMKAALESHNVELRGCEKTRKVIDIKPAAEHDWKTEYLDYIISIRTVESLSQAIDHINTYGSGHTDAIVTSDKAAAATFIQRVDSADVFWNASTRFADGFRYGLGAEVGISTHKLHARGPVGLEGLVIYKWILAWSGQVVADYSGEKAKPYTHKKLDKHWTV